MMRTVQHPIAMFVIVVLVVIAIGAGVVAVTTNQKVYGPSWGRFTVAFPGRVYQYRGHTSMTGGSSGATSFQSTLEFPFEYSIANRLAHARASTTLNVYAHAMPGGDRAAAEGLAQRLVGPPIHD